MLLLREPARRRKPPRIPHIVPQSMQIDCTFVPFIRGIASQIEAEIKALRPLIDEVEGVWRYFEALGLETNPRRGIEEFVSDIAKIRQLREQIVSISHKNDPFMLSESVTAPYFAFVDWCLYVLADQHWLSHQAMDWFCWECELGKKAKSVAIGNKETLIRNAKDFYRFEKGLADVPRIPKDKPKKRYRR